MRPNEYGLLSFYIDLAFGRFHFHRCLTLPHHHHHQQHHLSTQRPSLLCGLSLSHMSCCPCHYRLQSFSFLITHLFDLSISLSYPSRMVFTLWFLPRLFSK
ncbi:hypothetical protein Peur_017160 [Populus x canadensis]